MNDDARSVYEQHLRLIEEEEACAVEAAHHNAALKRIDAHRRYIHAQEKALLSAYKKSSKTGGAIQKKAENPQSSLQIIISQQNNATSTSTNSPTYNQHGDGGQYVADHMYTTPAANQ